MSINVEWNRDVTIRTSHRLLNNWKEKEGGRNSLFIGIQYLIGQCRSISNAQYGQWNICIVKW